eukprot:4803081-Pyramimonas_sp.AAC.1
MLRCRAAARSKAITLLSGVIPFRRCPCLRAGRRPLIALLADGLIRLRMKVPQGEVLVGRCGDSPEGRIPAMPGLQGVIRQRLYRECKRLF